MGSVLALEDITELESQRIGDLLSSVETLDNLFQHDHAHVSTVAAYVPHWIKFGYLNELLVRMWLRVHANAERAKLVEITHLYDNGSLVDFTPKELGGLVRALFADSPQRATLLDKIEM
jgi:centromere/kinetochore protein ZW10